jgi:excisionase family DNA binding protein
MAVDRRLQPYRLLYILSCPGRTQICADAYASFSDLQLESLSAAMMDRPMTVDEVALFCGVSAKTVRRAIERGDLDAARLGDQGAVRVRPEAIDEWFARRSTRRAARRAEVAPVAPVSVNGGRRRQRVPTPLRVGEDMGMR